MKDLNSPTLPEFPSYKESGAPWVGEIPSHWMVLRLKHWVRINESVLSETTDPDLEFRYMEIGAVNRGQLTETPQKTFFSAAPSRARRIVKAGDTIISTVRTYLKAIWYAENPGNDLVCSTGFAVLTPPNGTNSKFINYLIQSEPFTDRVTAESVGTAYPAVSENKLASFEVCIPPLDEQAAIVRYLDDADQRIRAYVSAKERLIALLEEEKQAVIHQAVTRGLDPNVRLKPSGVEWLGDVPEHWELAPFKRRVGFQEGPGIMASDFRESGVPLLRISCLRGPVATLNGCNYLDPDVVRARWSHFAVNEGDYLLSASASTGAVSLATSKVAGSIPYTGIIRLWPTSPRTVMPYVRLFLSSRLFLDQVDSEKAGVAISHFGPTHLGRMVITLPPEPEQQAIIQHIDRATAGIEAAITRARRQIELMEEYRTRLIADVVTGKTDVREEV